MQRYAVIPTYGRECFTDCVEAISPQVDKIFVIGHNYTPPNLPEKCELISYPVEVPNISTMWNLGIKAAVAESTEQSVVAVLNDDAIVPNNWFSRIEDQMAHYGAVVGCMNSGIEQVMIQKDPNPPWPRMEGFAFILSTEFGILLDEQFQWWWGDTDLDWQARLAGGTVLVPGVIEHRHPNSTTTGILAEIAGEDRKRFIDKWGSAPW